MIFGDHIKVKLDSFYHHGIFVSDNEVIHFCSDGKFSILSKNLEIQSTSIEIFAQGKKIHVVDYTNRFIPEKTVEIARQSIGNSDYDLSYNNCEHFVTRCITGTKQSKTIEKLFVSVLKVKRDSGINGFLFNLNNALKTGESNGWQ